MADRTSEDDLRKFFNSIDKNNNGFLDSAELQQALGMSSLVFSMTICAQMIRVHGKVRDGCITFEEFSVLYNNMQDCIDTFKAHDAEKKGKLRLDQVRAALRKFGYELDDTAFYTCCKSFDPDRTGDMGMPEFIAMNLFLLSATNTFKAFDFNKTGQIALNFGQFVYASANCR